MCGVSKLSDDRFRKCRSVADGVRPVLQTGVEAQEQFISAKWYK